MKRNHLKLFLCLLVASISLSANAQQEINVGEEFDQLIEDSNDWKNYRLIREPNILELKRKTVDQIESLEDRINQLEGELAIRDRELAELKESLRASKKEVNNLTTEKDEIQILGTSMEKASYNLIVWSIILILLLLFLVVLFRYRSSFAVIKEQKTTLSETERELEETRQKAIEKEQKMGRMLQDERNKNRGGGVK